MVIFSSDIKTCKQPDLSVDLNGFKLKNPIITASGTFGYADEFEDYIDVSALGAIVTKGITLHPRKGNPQPRLKELRNGMINSIGLENIGINAFIEKKIPVLEEKEINYIINIAGFSFDEYLQLARICEINKIKAIELNVSCPNVKQGCLEFGNCPETLYRLVSLVKETYTGTLIVKLTPNVTNPIELAQMVEKAGADAISAINTVKALNVTASVQDGKLVKQQLKGGMSGPAIKPIALNYINSISPELNIPIIGMGGISNFTDIIEFFAVGSTAIQVGTANFTNPTIAEDLVKELQEFLIDNNIPSLQYLLKGE
jgi:dihydroorotate dehydrogenase (NAD+) catalytic subunit